MADEPINELIPIPDGGDAEAKPLRQNFTYLDNQIKSLKSNLDNKVTTSSIDAANGICPLNANRKIPDGNIDYTNIDKKITTLGNTCVKTSGNQTVAGNKTFTGTSTFSGTTKVPASTATGTALRLSGRGTYSIELGDGTIINWGHKSTPSRTAKYDINFQIAFSNTNYSLILAPYNSGGWGTVTPCITKLAKGSATIMGDDGRVIYWIAVGR